MCVCVTSLSSINVATRPGCEYERGLNSCYNNTIAYTCKDQSVQNYIDSTG